MFVEWKDPWIKDRRYVGASFHVEGEEEDVGGVEKPADAVAEAIKERGRESARIGVEWQQIRLGTIERLRELLPRATFVDCDSILWELRMVKCEEEVHRMRVAADGCSRAADAAYRQLREGMTELEWEHMVVEGIHEAGLRHEYTEMAFGPKGAHLVDPTDNRLEDGHIVRLDIGGSFQGYQCDLSRSLAFGKVNDDVRRAHAAILRMNEELRKAVRPGVKCSDLYRMCMGIFDEEGYTALTRQAGHSLGRTVHEPPFLVEHNDRPLEPGMVVNVEPTMRIQGVGSVNIEDTMVVRDGEPECLTSVPRDLEHYLS
jgi:D-alanyl-D-alanine dipeptidase